jgi:hypothetical protein
MKTCRGLRNEYYRNVLLGRVILFASLVIHAIVAPSLASAATSTPDPIKSGLELLGAPSGESRSTDDRKIAVALKVALDPKTTPVNAAEILLSLPPSVVTSRALPTLIEAVVGRQVDSDNELHVVKLEQLRAVYILQTLGEQAAPALKVLELRSTVEPDGDVRVRIAAARDAIQARMKAKQPPPEASYRTALERELVQAKREAQDYFRSHTSPPHKMSHEAMQKGIDLADRVRRLERQLGK